jgi:hypothetical protein
VDSGVSESLAWAVAVLVFWAELYLKKAHIPPMKPWRPKVTPFLEAAAFAVGVAGVVPFGVLAAVVLEDLLLGVVAAAVGAVVLLALGAVAAGAGAGAGFAAGAGVTGGITGTESSFSGPNGFSPSSPPAGFVGFAESLDGAAWGAGEGAGCVLAGVVFAGVVGVVGVVLAGFTFAGVVFSGVAGAG